MRTSKVTRYVTLATLVLALSAAMFLRGTLSEDAKLVSKDGLHWHPILELYIDGKKQEIPPNIGLEATHAPVHTHEDASEGIVHLEFAGKVYERDLLLGRFFDEWGKSFNKDEFLGLKADATHQIIVTVDGAEVDTYEDTPLRDGEHIIINYDSI